MKTKISAQGEAAVAHRTKPAVAWVLLVVVLAMSLTGCGPGRERTRKASVDWSRGIELANNVLGGADLLVDGDGERIHLVWPAQVGSRVRIRYMQLDEMVNPVLDQYLEMETAWPRNAQLAEAQGDRLHLFWVNRLGGERAWALWHGFIDALTGELVDTVRISLDGQDVDSFAIAPDGSQGAYVFWDALNAAGISGVHLSALGEVDDGPVTITPSGSSPTAAMDGSGNLHLAWLDGTELIYAMLPGVELQAVEGSSLTILRLFSGDTIDGPRLGFSEGWVYVLWSVSTVSGLEPGTAKGWYAAFPENEARALVPETVQLVPFEEQTYHPYEGVYGLTVLAEPAVAPYGSPYVENPAPVAGESSALVAAISMDQAYRLDTFLQIAIVVFEEGEFVGYQVATKTTSISRGAVITADDADNLYLAWREGATGGRVYFASTAPAVREALDRVDSAEVFRVLVSAGVDGFASFGFFPFAFFWLAPGLIMLGLVEVFGKETDINRPLPLALFIISLLIYQLMKIIIIPTIFTYVPFSAWLDVAQALGFILRIAVPLLTLGIGLLVAWWIARRRDTRSVFMLFFATAGIDALLTLLIYGVNFMGAF